MTEWEIELVTVDGEVIRMTETATSALAAHGLVMLRSGVPDVAIVWVSVRRKG